MTAPPLPIARIVPVVAHAVAVFGDEHKASHWLSTPLPLLENRRIYARLDGEGSRRVGGRKAGDDWLMNGESAVLRVPSAVIKGDWNYLINPLHLDFAQVRVEPPVPMRFDERLFGKT